MNDEQKKKMWENNWPLIACAFESIKHENEMVFLWIDDVWCPWAAVIRWSSKQRADFRLTLFSAPQMASAPQPKWEQSNATVAIGLVEQTIENASKRCIHFVLIQIHAIAQNGQCGRMRYLWLQFYSIFRILSAELCAVSNVREMLGDESKSNEWQRTKGDARIGFMRQKWSTMKKSLAVARVRARVCVCAGARQ